MTVDSFLELLMDCTPRHSGVVLDLHQDGNNVHVEGDIDVRKLVRKLDEEYKPKQ